MKIKRIWNKWSLWIIIAFLLSIWFFRRGINQATGINIENMTTGKPRGIRNNNPLNIKHSSANWQGKSEIQTDKTFVQFKSMEYGARAGMIILRTYFQKYGLNTVEKIIDRFAPASDGNFPIAYVKSVVDYMNGRGFKITGKTELDWNTHIIALATGMSRVEVGTNFYDEQWFIDGKKLI